jgi:hypothetical protein
MSKGDKQMHSQDFTKGNGAVATKDHLLGLLHEPAPDIRLDNIEVVLTVLENTHGLFSDLNYSYKAVEIATMAGQYLSDMLTHCQHYKRINRLVALRDRCGVLQQQYYRLQYRPAA